MKRTLKLYCTILMAVPLFALSAPAGADTCRCKAHFEIRYESRGVSFKPDVPVDHFTALNSKGAFQTNNACRREARDQAHSCMDGIWKGRHTPTNKSSHCSTSKGIRGSVPYDIKRFAERAACQTGSPVANRHNAVVKIYRRTHGGRGCGPNLKTVRSVFVSNYEVDCLSIRNRQRLGAVAETRIAGIDRPGSDLSGSGVTVGNGSAEACKAACGLRSGCKAWTWVPSGVQGSGSRCWLKGNVPWYRSNGSGMVSGTRQHVSQ